MSPDKIIALALAALVLVGPALLKRLEAVGWPVLPDPSLPPPAPGKPAGTTSYITAIENLGIVRTRLVQTESLGEAQKAAIDTLTLALVSGSDK